MNYYQQANSTFNINPFQQNVDIIKNFFRKPIVLINTIFETITIPITIFLLFSLSSLTTTSLYNELYSHFYYDENFIHCIPLYYYFMGSFYYICLLHGNIMFLFCFSNDYMYFHLSFF